MRDVRPLIGKFDAFLLVEAIVAIAIGAAGLGDHPISGPFCIAVNAFVAWDVLRRLPRA